MTQAIGWGMDTHLSNREPNRDSQLLARNESALTSLGEISLDQAVLPLMEMEIR